MINKEIRCYIPDKGSNSTSSEGSCSEMPDKQRPNLVDRFAEHLEASADYYGSQAMNFESDLLRQEAENLRGLKGKFKQALKFINQS